MEWLKNENGLEPQEKKDESIVEDTNSKSAILQRLLWIAIILGLFFYLKSRGEEIPEFLQGLLVVGIWSLIIGVQNFLEYFRKK
jgi:hypothetical protein